MERSRIRQLHYITDMANMASILEQGILSHRLAQRAASGHVSVADAEVQVRRASKRVWVGRSSRPLHDYANLYVHARNAMLSILLHSGQGDLTVLAIDPAVLDLDGVVVADRNAASFASLFLPAAEGIAALDEAAVFAEWWTSSYEAKQLRMAEVLIPDACRHRSSKVPTSPTTPPPSGCAAISVDGHWRFGSTRGCSFGAPHDRGRAQG